MAPRAKTKDDVIHAIINRWGECADFSKSVYNGYKEMMTGVICNECGKEFQFIPANIVNAPKSRLCFCGHCAKEKQRNSTKITLDEFIERANSQHNNKFTYFRETWVDFQTPMKMQCNDCGYVFESTPTGHLSSGGCRKCADKENSKRLSYDAKTALQKMKESVHDVEYDYSKVVDTFISMSKPVTIICPIHGEFEQTPQVHCSGRGCPKCGRNKTDSKRRLANAEIIERFRAKHRDRYDYSKVNYIDKQLPVTIICPIHGEFEQTPEHHELGCECPKCALIESGLKKRKTFEEWIPDIERVHGNRYTYNKETYTKSNIPMEIVCPEHGVFVQSLANHVWGGQDCPKCFRNSSKKENEIIEFLKNAGISNVITGSRDILSDNKELDIYLPEHKLAIEFDGLYWHSELKVSSEYHKQKTDECIAKGIQLIHIFEDEWVSKQELVKSRLKTLLHLTTKRLYARCCSCYVFENENVSIKQFLDNNHLQGYARSDIQCIAYHNNQIVAVMTFTQNRYGVGMKNMQQDNVWELSRFCTLRDTIIVGIASKLLKQFITEYKPTKIISYSDRRYSTGNVYLKLGFTKTKTTPVGYSYVVSEERKHRLNFTKSVLKEKYGCPDNVSEHEFCLQNHWYRIYDCGKDVFELTL